MIIVPHVRPIFDFPQTQATTAKKSMSVDSGAVIFDRKSYEQYIWPEPEISTLHD
jgi:hypothetical protein